MISVAICINGQPIMARSAVNTGHQDRSGRHCYRVDDGSKVMHAREAGAVALAIKLLKTIKEPK